jgi:hypothetical protein
MNHKRAFDPALSYPRNDGKANDLLLVPVR